MKVSVFLFSALALLIASTSCTNHHLDLEVCDTPPVVSYSTDISVLMTTYCSAPYYSDCHENGSGNGDFSQFGGLNDKATEVYARAIDLKTMPPSNSSGPTSLERCDLETLKSWLDAGAPNN